MRLADVLLPLLACPAEGGVIALVGAGGKTSGVFALGEAFAAQGRDVVLTTTTHIFDPRRERGRPFDRLVLDPRCREVPGGETLDLWGGAPPAGRRIVLGSTDDPDSGKLRGIHPAWPLRLRLGGVLVVVEADGAKLRPIKAPAAHEPVIPEGTEIVVGVVGLDCLGRAMNGDAVHRPEHFTAVTGCAPGQPIEPRHLAALARSPLGLFKDAPAEAKRVFLLNKADRCALAPDQVLERLAACGPIGADWILVGRLRDPDPFRQVLAALSGNRPEPHGEPVPCP